MDGKSLPNDRILRGNAYIHKILSRSEVGRARLRWRSAAP
jgi:hypothetical protein